LSPNTNSALKPLQKLDRANQLARWAGLLAGLTILVFGLNIIWNVIVADLFGTSAELDAFWVGAAIPKAISDSLHFGLLTLAFVIIFNTSSADSSDRWRLASSTLNLVLLFTSGVIALILIGAPIFVKLMAPALPSQTLAVHTLRTLSLMLIPTALVGAFAGILNARQDFLPFSISRLAGLSVQIVVLYMSADKLRTDALVWGMVLGALAMLAICLGSFRRLGFRYTPSLKFRGAEARAVLRLFTVLVSLSFLTQLNQAVNRFFASLLGPGSVSALEFAWRFELPISQILGVAVALPSFALFALHAASDDMVEFRDTLAITVRLVGLLVVPLIGFMAVLREPLTFLWFRRGEFSSDAALLVASLLPPLGVILICRSFSSVMVFGLLALQKTNALMGIMFLEVVTGAGLTLILTQFLGVKGIVVATALAMTASNLWLWTLLVRRVGKLSFRSFTAQAWKIITANLVAVVLLEVIYLTLWADSYESTALTMLKLTGMGFAFLGAYTVACRSLGLIELGMSDGQPQLRLKPSEWNSSA
jgi:putative peptidoglycan lipid II flippase